MVHGGLTAFLRALGAWALGRRRLLRIAGGSMAPALPAGSLAWWEPLGARAPAPGDLVLVRHPYRRNLRLVKRVACRQADGGLYLLGDEPAASTDSRHFGAVPRRHILGFVHSLFP